MNGEVATFEAEIVAGRGGGAMVEAPPELQAALESDAEARRRYDALSYTHRREFAEWVGEAKKQETRDRRAGKAIERLRAGETR